jgi:putative tryptophan/tyrosine transport system substrate-binding protein
VAACGEGAAASEHSPHRLSLQHLCREDPDGQVRGNAFVQGLQEQGWSVGRNLRIDYRWGLADADRLRTGAQELVALAPDALFAAGGPAVASLQQATRSLPIVFANVTDPVGAGWPVRAAT